MAVPATNWSQHKPNALIANEKKDWGFTWTLVSFI